MNKATIRLVVAYTLNRCIGKDKGMPWHLPSDLKHFKQVTMGLPIIMGRKTWESLGRPLPGRLNLVVSRDEHYAAPGAQVHTSLELALGACHGGHTVCVIGGEQLFRLAMPIAHEIYATEIQANIAGDTFFPDLPIGQWREVERLAQPEENGLRYDFVVYRRQ